METTLAGSTLDFGFHPALRDGRFARFDRDAMAQLDALCGFAFRLTEVREEPEDLVSDSMLRAFQCGRQFNLGTNIRAWLFTILCRAFVSRKRCILQGKLRGYAEEMGIQANPRPAIGTPAAIRRDHPGLDYQSGPQPDH